MEFDFNDFVVSVFLVVVAKRCVKRKVCIFSLLSLKIEQKYGHFDICKVFKVCL